MSTLDGHDKQLAPIEDTLARARSLGTINFIGPAQNREEEDPSEDPYFGEIFEEIDGRIGEGGALPHQEEGRQIAIR